MCSFLFSGLSDQNRKKYVRDKLTRELTKKYLLDFVFLQ